ncbi:MAG: hypothetical protein HZB70_00710 [Candidatus Berkelbacteria bacterium]|nr:MAG: hypothetical protein HZB70_00710 [Candidatus Berkelbacteria bacterium]QQG52141.1 MAG: hypothetical protein HY845_02285 [Candidatus Berkelbacteria bacterium]
MYKAKKLAAVAEVEDIDYNPKELALLRSGTMISGSFDPYAPLRQKIKKARAQFAGSTDYPCILYVKDNTHRAVTDPMFVYGAMFGNIAVSMPIDADTGTADIDQQSLFFGSGGRMVDPHRGTWQNQTISAVGILRSIYPDRMKSRYEEQLAELVKECDVHDQGSLDKYLSSASGLEETLTKEGYDLQKEVASVTYHKNPTSHLQLPGKFYGGKYDYVYDYDLQTGEIKLLSKPSL